MEKIKSINNFYYSWWKNLDKSILLTILILFFIGLFFSLASTSLVASDKLDTNDYFFFFKHLAYILLGLFIIFTVSSVNYENLFQFSLFFFIISLLFLFLVPLIGVEVKGSKRWIDLVFLPRFQPIEILKPFLIIIIAMILCSKKIKDKNLKYFFSFIITTTVSLLLILQPDIGQTLLVIFCWSILIFISGERTALGLLFLSTVFIIIFLSKYKKIRFLTFLVSLVIMTFLALYNPAIKERNIDHTLNQFYNDGSLTLFSKRHESHIGGAWNMFRESPLIGQGPKMFRVLCNDSRFNYNDDSCSTHPHNTYAQLAAETGIFGLLFILLLCFKVIKVVLEHGILYIRKQKYLLSDFQVCLIACLIVTLWPIIPTQNFFNNWINVIYYLPIGFLLFSIHEKRKNLDI